jgi:hypothetical protein
MRRECAVNRAFQFALRGKPPPRGSRLTSHVELPDDPHGFYLGELRRDVTSETPFICVDVNTTQDTAFYGGQGATMLTVVSTEELHVLRSRGFALDIEEVRTWF